MLVRLFSKVYETLQHLGHVALGNAEQLALTVMERTVEGKRQNDNDNDVYFTLATSDSRIGKYKTENN